jgi:predicted amidohydrolase
VVRVAAAQVAIDVDAPDATWRGAVALLEQAVSDEADLVVLPELVTTGSGFADAAEATRRAEPLDGPTITALRELSAEHGIVLAAGFNETSGLDRPYNSAVVIDRGELLTCYRKTHLWDREKLLFTAGDQPPPLVDTSVGRIGLMVCYDSASRRESGRSRWPRLRPRPPRTRPTSSSPTAVAPTAARRTRVAA